MLRWTGSFVLVVALVLLGLTAWVLGTESGANWLAREAELLTDGAVRMTGVHGSLAEGVEIDDFEIIAGATKLGGQGLVLRFVPAGLLSGRLSVPALRAQRIELVIPPASRPAGEPFRTPQLSVPFLVEVDDLVVGILEIRSGASVRTVTGIHLAGSMHDTRLELRRLQGGLSGFELRADGSVRFEPGLPVDGRIEWRLADPAVSGAGTVRGNLSALEVTQILHLPEAVTVSGTLYDVVARPRVEGTATWDAIQLQVPGIGAVDTSAGRATLEGTLAAWNVTLVAAARAEALPVVQAHAAAHGDLERVVFDELRLDSNAGALAAQGELSLEPPRRLGLDIRASKVDTSALRPGLQGRFSARARLDAELPGETRIRIADLRGSLMGRPLAGSGDIGYRDGLLSFGNVVLRAGPNHLRADGSLGDRLAGRIDVDAPELSVLWPGLAGSLTAHAALAGTRAQPVIDLDASGRQLALAGNTVQALELHGRVDRLERVDATLSAHGIETGGNALGNLDAGLEGTLDSHRLTAHLGGGLLEASVASAGRWNGKALQHRIGSASIRTDELGPWQLAGEPDVTVSAAAATAADHCWEQPPASLCLSALLWSPAHSHVVAVLSGLDMRYFDRWLPEDVTITGRAYAALSLDVTAAGPEGSGIWRQEDTTVYYTGGDEPLVTPLETAQLAAQFTPEEVLATLEMHAPGGVQLSGTGRMHWPVGVDAPFEGRIAGRLPDIAPLLPWIAGDFDLAEVAGGVTLDAGVAGTLAAPRVTGEVRLSGGEVALADLGVTLKEIDIALLGDGSDALKLQGSAKAGGGLLTLDGELRPIEKGGPTGWVRIRGNKVDAVRLPDRYVQASPDLTLRYAAGEFSIEGGVTIPKAEIVVRALPESAVSPSNDTVVHDREALEAGAGRGRIIGGEFAVTLGPAVRLKAFGLDTLLEGTVKLSQGADGEPKGYGVVRLEEGKFGAYGKELTIERGTLGFAGPLDDPSIELRASRVVVWEGRTVTAGVMVTGTVTRPESRVFSDPAMSEVDALSYLISGRPMQSTTSTDRSSIGSAALALGVKQASPLTQSLGSVVTLDELGMQGATLEETEMVAGKQLGSDLYVRFTYGLFNRIGTVLARYKIHRNLSIEAASGEDQSLDLIYSIERD